MFIIEITGWQKPSAPRRPRDLIDFLMSIGGIADYNGELRHMDLQRVQKGKFGRLARRNGVPLDYAREAAAEAGYLDPNSDINDLIQALYVSTHGQPVYSTQDTDTLLAWQEAERADRQQQQPMRQRRQPVRQAQPAPQPAPAQDDDFWNPNNLFAGL